MKKFPTKLTQEEFNRMMVSILLMFMKYENIPPEERQKKLIGFNEFCAQAEKLSNIQNGFEKNEESIQHGQIDQREKELI